MKLLYDNTNKLAKEFVISGYTNPNMHITLYQCLAFIFTNMPSLTDNPPNLTRVQIVQIISWTIILARSA